MSHFASVTSKIKDKEALVAALNELKLEFVEATSVGLIEMNTNWSGNEKQLVDLVIRREVLGCGADVGFRYNSTEKSYEVIADDWELQRSRFSSLRQSINEEYAVAVAVKTGYRVTSRTRAADGRLQVQLEAQQQVTVRR